MVNVYSIKEILEASDNILKSPTENKDGSSIYEQVLETKDISILAVRPSPLNIPKRKENISTDLEKIILEAESAQFKTNDKMNSKTENKEKQNLPEENIIIQKDLIDDLYKTFGKKIKKNTLQLILELRKDITHLTNNISSLKQNKIKLEQNSIKLNKNINNLKDEESNLKNNLDQSINGFNKLNYEHKNLRLTFNKIEENLLDNNKKLNETVETNNQLNHNLKRSKESFNTLYDNHKDLKLNFSTVEEDLNYKKKKIKHIRRA